MARGKLKQPELDSVKVNFEELSSRKMVHDEIDLVDNVHKPHLQVWSADLTPARLKDSVYKLTIRYLQGDEERARKVEKEALDRAREFAYHIYVPERIVVKAGRTRMPEVKADEDPLDAAMLWMKEKPPKLCGRKEALTLVKELLTDAPRPEPRKLPQPFRTRFVQGHDFGPFRDLFDIQNIGNGVIGVIGCYDGRVGCSNRSGKTDFMSAFKYALWGDSGGKNQDRLIHDGMDGMAAVIAADDWKIERSLKRGGNAKVEINGKRFGVPEARKEVEDRLGITKVDFMRTCFVGPGDLLGMLAQGGAQIHQDMMRWLGLEVWKHVYDAAKKTRDELEKEMDGKAAVLEAAMGQLNNGRPSVEQVEAAEREVKRLDVGSGKGAKLDLRLRELQDQYAHRRKIDDAKEVAKRKIILQRNLKDFRISFDEVEQELEQVRERVGRLKYDVKECNSNLREFGGKCPVDSAECPRTDEINVNEGPIKKKLAGCKGQLKREKEVRDKLVEKSDAWSRSILETENQLAEAQEAEEFLESLGSEGPALKRIDLEIKKVIKLGEELPDENDLDAAQGNLVELRVQVREYEHAQAKFASITKEAEKIAKRLHVYRYATRLAGNGGVPSMQIENAVGVLEGMANEVMIKMGAEHRLEFVFEVEKKNKKEDECGICGRVYQKGERKCPECGVKRGNAKSDTFEPMVREGEWLRPLELDSQGGRTLLALAMRIALTQFLGIRFLWLDEICGSLDDANVDALIRLLYTLPEMGFDQVFVISHRSKITEALQRNIRVTRFAEEGRSSVEWDAEN